MKNVSAKKGEGQKVINGFKIIDLAGKGAFG